ncbi:MAG: FeoB-associated Cys-rich membrane protein [Butyrivibrio sp.]|nr:FeoB-associated Cys-rich membrane protein [Butyrivibrio sp.]MBE5827931.1 FeoB-associated Cys-rich membrane protein [Butyrivibrio sp.]MBP3278574.1 FeoB-associated Cys-rich membrane protein [Butyrivibrio sp.]MBP3784641.1 FeoB-associated Cys-rich membrane protein [Butyrivibrio sp.]MBP3813835.1 FeoB-associated Cys-rich membrane protein [Butyrivibrio sp.]
MADLIAILVIALILFLAIRYIYKEKKKGTRCIGCPSAGNCHKAACNCKN